MKFSVKKKKKRKWGEDVEIASIDNEIVAHGDSGVKRGFLSSFLF